MRLWGKILCSGKDYYVAEGVQEAAEAEEGLPPQVEPKGVGVNKLNYYVTNDISGKWSELPIVTPE